MAEECSCSYGTVYGPGDGRGDPGEPCPDCAEGYRETERRAREAQRDAAKYTRAALEHRWLKADIRRGL